MKGRGAILQIVSQSCVDGIFESFIRANGDPIVPFNAQKGTVLNPLEGRVATKEQWQTELANKITVFSDEEYTMRDEKIEITNKIMIPLPGRTFWDTVPTKEDWQAELTNKIKVFPKFEYKIPTTLTISH